MWTLKHRCFVDVCLDVSYGPHSEFLWFWCWGNAVCLTSCKWSSCTGHTKVLRFSWSWASVYTRFQMQQWGWIQKHFLYHEESCHCSVLLQRVAAQWSSLSSKRSSGYLAPGAAMTVLELKFGMNTSLSLFFLQEVQLNMTLPDAREATFFASSPLRVLQATILQCPFLSAISDVNVLTSFLSNKKARLLCA